MTERRLDFPPYSLWETRAGAGTPVALVHGLSGSSRWWMRNFDALAAHYLVAAVDLTGFGRNHRSAVVPDIPPSFRETTSLLARWLETFGEPVHLVGHSMGGQLSIRLAAERPDLVRSLMLVNSAGMPFRIAPLAHMRELPKPPYGAPEILRILVPDLLRAGPAALAVASTRIILGDMRPMMRQVRAPSLLVWGESDPIVPLHYGEEMACTIPNARLVVIPRAAHVAMWEAPEEFNRIALDFLAEVDEQQGTRNERAFAWGIAGWTNGIAHRQAGRRRDIVLIHGLGMSSAYFSRLARALFDGGWNPIAPDLPGFGESANARAGGADEHANALASWADALGIRDAVWLGHSIGCNAVARLAELRPDLVRSSVMVGPLWTTRPYPQLRTFANLAIDAFREPLALYRYVLPAYWRTGIWRWFWTWRRFLSTLRATPPNALFIAGERDPIPDRTRVKVVHVKGAHACVFSHAKEVAAAAQDDTVAPDVIPSEVEGSPSDRR
ncbi:MAG: alpha/beta fold hydrolase [Acidobacteriota bacterium]|nr:alpha/beta fold hydrolase [Acidobacteriota bacterium]